MPGEAVRRSESRVFWFYFGHYELIYNLLELFVPKRRVEAHQLISVFLKGMQRAVRDLKTLPEEEHELLSGQIFNLGSNPGSLGGLFLAKIALAQFFDLLIGIAAGFQKLGAIIIGVKITTGTLVRDDAM